MRSHEDTVHRMLHFCTYFDHRYFSRGLALYFSLTRYASPCTLYVLCLDDRTYSRLRDLQLPGIHGIRLMDFELDQPDLLTVKQQRDPVDYYLTCTPCLPLYILKHFPSIDVITYVDSDLYFFANPRSLFTELGDNSILIIPHRFEENRVLREALQGTYNVGLIVFRNDAISMECLEWWKQKCLEWCAFRIEDLKYGDQKYLDDWPERFPGVVVSQNKGAGLAPWNVTGAQLRVQEGALFVDSDPLVFYHFSRVGILSKHFFTHTFMPTGVLKKFVYAPYVRELKRAWSSSWFSPQGYGPLSDLFRKILAERTLVASGPFVITIDGPRMLTRFRRAIRVFSFGSN